MHKPDESYTTPGQLQPFFKRFTPDYAPYEALYKKIHANAELSWQEHETAALIVQVLEGMSSDLEIRTNIGGTGLIGILRNGPGRTVLLRADMDGLPVKERTGLDYASQKEMRDAYGVLQPTMHACGHDMHVTALLAAAKILVSSQACWSGTVIFLFQPAEEKAAGARDMVDAGLFTTHKCPIPDVFLGQHVYWGRAGSLATRPGPIMAGTDGLLITVFGTGGHGSTPEVTVDPVVLASHIVIRLQGIVSREIPAGELAVVTVGAINAGTAENIISDRAQLKVNTRSVSPKWKEVILNAVKRIVRAECQASNCPKEPIFEATVSAPPTINDPSTTSWLNSAFISHFGNQHNPNLAMIPASEDFSNLATAVNRPSCFWFFGGHDPADWDAKQREGKLAEVPSNHSPFFAPVIQPTLKTGTEALVVATLSYLQSRGEIGHNGSEERIEWDRLDYT